MPCHHDTSGTALVNNKGYENSDTGSSLAVNGSTAAHVVGKSYVQFEMDAASGEKRFPEPPMEEVALHTIGMTTAEEIRRLCPCEEEGRTCRCSAIAGSQNSNAEPWNKCKMIALGIVTALVGVWLVVYITLSQKQFV